MTKSDETTEVNEPVEPGEGTEANEPVEPDETIELEDGVENQGDTTAKPPYKEENVTVPKVEKVTKFKAYTKKKGFALHWKKVSGADGYQIQISTKKF